MFSLVAMGNGVTGAIGVSTYADEDADLLGAEVRYRTVTRTDSEGKDYDVDVPYNYYICYVTLENFNLSNLLVYIMNEEPLSRYALYMATLGNRPDLFPSSPYVSKYTNKPPAHGIPEGYLSDETFAAILKEAEKTPMCGAAAARVPLSIAPASSAMSTINAAGTSGGWGAGAIQHLHPDKQP